MSLVNPSAGRAFIWIITCFLFFSILSGGGCLLMYMILPETETTAWLPVAGLSLVCLPWFFWLLTFFYRIISRACGFRVSLGIGVDDNAMAAANNGNVNNNNNNASAESPRYDEGDQANEDGSNNGDQRRSHSSSNNSVASRESEMPLAITMGS